MGAEKNNLDMMKLLTNAGAQVNVKDKVSPPPSPPLNIYFNTLLSFISSACCV